jgi:hypothetical protein
LIVIRQQGRERFCEARLQKLNEVSKWIEQYRVFWSSKLDALESFLNKPDTPPRKSSGKRVGNKIKKKSARK